MESKLQLPVFAGAYKGAVYLLHTKSPGYITFVSHIGRDILNFLPRIVVGVSSARVQYEQHLDRLQNKWQDGWSGRGLVTAHHSGEGQLIPYDVCEMITEILKEHREGRKRSKGAGEHFLNTFLGSSDRDKITDLIKWKQAKGFFLECAHLREKKFSTDISSKLNENFRILEEFLYIAATSEYSRIRSLNEILEETNS